MIENKQPSKPESGSSKGPTKGHIKLTSHPSQRDAASKLTWGAPSARERGPVVGSVNDGAARNVIGAHSGSYSIYRALAVAAGTLDPVHIADLTDTSPAANIGPYPRWGDPSKIVSLDPYGHMVSEVFAEQLAAGLNITPTIAVTKARVNLPEIKDAMRDGRLKADGELLTENGDVRVTKAAIEPVWYLPGIAERFRCIGNGSAPHPVRTFRWHVHRTYHAQRSEGFSPADRRSYRVLFR